MNNDNEPPSLMQVWSHADEKLVISNKSWPYCVLTGILFILVVTARSFMTVGDGLQLVHFPTSHFPTRTVA